MADQDREDAALDALIVLAMRGYDWDGERVVPVEPDFDDIDPDSLPGLSPDERAAMERIDIEAIIRKGMGEGLTMLCEICREREVDGPGRLWCGDCGLAIAYLAVRLGPTIAREVLARRRGRPLGADEYVNHLDGDPTDNRPENLAIVSARGEGRG